MFKKTVIGLTCLLAGISAPAHATDFYFTAGVGQASLNHPGDNKWFIQKGWDYTIDGKSTGFRLGLGAQFSKYLALEANYHNLGKYEHFALFMMNEDVYSESSPTLCTGTCEPTTAGYLSGRANAVSLTAMPTLPITKDLSIYGRLGAAYFRAQFDVRFIPTDPMQRQWHHIRMSSSGITPVWGGGVKYGNWGLDVIQMPAVKVKSSDGACCGPYTSAAAYTISYQWDFR